MNITQEQALNMILASIAREELGLSHIINAEGEKIQFALGTLPGQKNPCNSLEEVLAVNDSVAAMLDSVMQNQLLLKSKLDKVLQAKCSCAPPCPPPCKSSIRLKNEKDNEVWKNGCRFPWKCCCVNGCDIKHQACDPTTVYLKPGKRYWVSYSFTLCAFSCKSSAGIIQMDMPKCCDCAQVPPYHFHTPCLLTGWETFSSSALICPRECDCECVPLALVLHCLDCIRVEDASLSIMEV